ncbi:MAG: XRE family transcriptional regulator [Candidatus Omnitrophota bacterium]|jgi:SOS-response transcriptional repressor LexA
MSRKIFTTDKIISERLKILIEDRLKMTQAKFSREVGISQGYLSMILSGKRGPSAELIAGIYLNYRKYLSWILTGDDQQDCDIVIEAHPRVIPLGEKIPPPSPDDLTEYLAVPLVEGRIAAGPGRIVREDIHSFVWVFRPEVGKRRNLVAVRIGDQEKSMLPTLAPGSILIIDRNDKEIIRKGVYAVRTGNDECAVKRVHISDNAILLSSDNPDYPPFLAPTTEIDELIVGRVIWTWKSLLY